MDCVFLSRTAGLKQLQQKAEGLCRSVLKETSVVDEPRPCAGDWAFLRLVSVDSGEMLGKCSYQLTIFSCPSIYYYLEFAFEVLHSVLCLSLVLLQI